MRNEFRRKPYTLVCSVCFSVCAYLVTQTESVSRVLAFQVIRCEARAKGKLLHLGKYYYYYIINTYIVKLNEGTVICNRCIFL